MTNLELVELADSVDVIYLKWMLARKLHEEGTSMFKVGQAKFYKMLENQWVQVPSYLVIHDHGFPDSILKFNKEQRESFEILIKEYHTRATDGLNAIRDQRASEVYAGKTA